VQRCIRRALDGADLGLYLVSQQLVRSDTLSRRPDLLFQEGSAEEGLVVGEGFIPYINGEDYARVDSRRNLSYHGTWNMGTVKQLSVCGESGKHRSGQPKGSLTV
jgi:hypothetical protein